MWNSFTVLFAILLSQQPASADRALEELLVKHMRAVTGVGCERIDRMRTLLAAYDLLRESYADWDDLAPFRQSLRGLDATCPRPSLGPLVALSAGIGSGGIKHRVPATVLATLYMSEAEQTAFMQTLDPAVRADIIEWEKQHPDALPQITSAIAPLLADIRRAELAKDLQNRIKVDPTLLKLDLSSLVKTLSQPGSIRDRRP